MGNPGVCLRAVCAEEAEAMDVDVRDADLTLEYRRDAATARSLPFGLAACLVGLLMMTDQNPSGKRELAAWIGVAAGLAMIGFALWRRCVPGKPQFVLSPQGVRYRLRSDEILIPWREIRDVGMTDWEMSTGRSRSRIRDVTVLLVSREFHDLHLLPLRRATDWLWDNLFKPAGPSIQVALDHEAVSVDPAALRDAVVTRWHAFRGEAAGAPSAAAGSDTSDRPGRTSVASMASAGRSDGATDPGAAPPAAVFGATPRKMPAWYLATNVALLLGIAVVLARLLGLWGK